jgi:hypothetical protein
MPSNAKPRKPYRARPVLKPLGIKNHFKLEMPGHVGLLALGKGWLDITHLRDIGAHVALVEKISDVIGDACINAMAKGVIEICMRCEDRFERTARPGTTGEEMHTIKAALSVTMPWLAAQPNILIHNCSNELVRAFDRAVEQRDAS